MHFNAPILDGIASVLISLVLATTALLQARESKGLLELRVMAVSHRSSYRLDFVSFQELTDQRIEAFMHEANIRL